MGAPRVSLLTREGIVFRRERNLFPEEQNRNMPANKTKPKDKETFTSRITLAS